MGRKILVEKLNDYQPSDAAEKEMQARMIDFVEKNEDCFLRSNLSGHMTGSAIVIDLEREHILMLHHKKLNKWLQPGGHADGDTDILNVATKEVNEETGLMDVKPVQETIFDVDIHEIPERKGVPAHFHYDLRFLLEADRNTPLQINNESLDLEWVAISDVPAKNDEESIMRMVRKCQSLFQQS
ncbi:NUDIX hydrolase [Flammeovirgaceae bacterium SG7u.111]|nr:NUDIX hydrolase [Flammeovirgaceae bacterium SG7u.132]WPO35040.1 NUDIX hydrolase [Flammeovirgaceae bacterium SG7u.111]